MGTLLHIYQTIGHINNEIWWQVAWTNILEPCMLQIYLTGQIKPGDISKGGKWKIDSFYGQVTLKKPDDSPAY